MLEIKPSGLTKSQRTMLQPFMGDYHIIVKTEEQAHIVMQIFIDRVNDEDSDMGWRGKIFLFVFGTYFSKAIKEQECFLALKTLDDFGLTMSLFNRKLVI